MDKYALIIFDLDGTLVKSWTDELLPGVSEFFSRDNLPKLAVVSNQGGVGLRRWMEQDGFGDPSGYPTQTVVEARLFRIDNLLSQVMSKVLSFNQQTMTTEQVATLVEAIKRDVNAGELPIMTHVGCPAQTMNYFVSWSYQVKSGTWCPIPPNARVKSTTRLSSGSRLISSWARDWRKPQIGMLKQAMDYAGVSPSQVLMVGDMDSDMGAATNANCDFMWADKFFGRE